MEIDMDKKIIKKLIKLGLPVMAATILQVLLGSVDLFFVSRYGRDVASATTMGGGMFNVIFIISMLISAGLTPIISQNYGAGKIKTLKAYAKRGFILSLILGSIVFLVVIFFNVDILKFMYNPSEIVLKYSLKYLNIVYFATVFVFLNGTMRAIFHAVSDTITPLIILGGANVLNAILDYIFVGLFKMQIEGVAIATVISIILSTIILFICYRLKIGKMVSSEEDLFISNSKILKIGSWSMMQQLARPITGMLMYRIVFKINGSVGVAAFGIGGQIFSYSFIFLSGLSVAISVLVGQSVGAENFKDIGKIIRNGFILCFINIALFFIPYFVFSEQLMRFFINDNEVIREGVRYLHIVYLGIILVPISTVLGGYYLGIGKTQYPFWASFISNVAIKVPIAYIMGILLFRGVTGVWVAIMISVWIESFIMIGSYIKRGGKYEIEKN
jgi:putative MATE family efflux protein